MSRWNVDHKKFARRLKLAEAIVLALGSITTALVPVIASLQKVNQVWIENDEEVASTESTQIQ